MAKKEGGKSTPVKDAYANIPPEHDGRAWYVPPPGWVDLNLTPRQLTRQASQTRCLRRRFESNWWPATPTAPRRFGVLVLMKK